MDKVFGSDADSKLVQLLNAFSPINFTELGISIDLRARQQENADAPIETTELGITIDESL